MDKILIYVLLLTDNCYYIGKTTKTVEGRFKEHLIGSAAWTTLHKPLKIIETLTLINPMDEDIITKKYMLKYGIENVRGGSYTKITLDDWMIQALNHEFTTIDDCCYKCKQPGHFAKECYNIIEYFEKLIKDILTDDAKLTVITNEIDRLSNLILIINKLNIVISLTNSISIFDSRYEIINKDTKKIKINKDLLPIVSKFKIVNDIYEKKQNPRDETPEDKELFIIYNQLKQIVGTLDIKANRRFMDINYVPTQYNYNIDLDDNYFIKFITTNNYKIITLQIIIFNKEKQNYLDKIIKDETSIKLIEQKIEFLLNEKLNLI